MTHLGSVPLIYNRQAACESVRIYAERPLRSASLIARAMAAASAVALDLVRIDAQATTFFWLATAVAYAGFLGPCGVVE